MQHWWASWFGDPEYEVDAMTVRTILQDKDYLIINHSTLFGQRAYWCSILVGSGTRVDFGCWCCSAVIEEARLIDSFDGVEGYYNDFGSRDCLRERENGLMWFFCDFSQGELTD